MCVCFFPSSVLVSMVVSFLMTELRARAYMYIFIETDRVIGLSASASVLLLFMINANCSKNPAK